MLKRFLMRKTRSAERQVASCPTRHIDDLVAEHTRWTPMRGGGMPYRTHRLVSVSAVRLQFKATPHVLVFGSVLVGVGVVLLTATISAMAQRTHGWDALCKWLFLSLAFGGSGFWVLRRATVPIVFDTEAGYFWRGRSDPAHLSADEHSDAHAGLDEVHAFQIIAKDCIDAGGDARSRFRSFELNLVLHDTRRLHVVDHGNYDKLLAEARQIAEVLKIPVWDASQGRPECSRKKRRKR